jgi:hypothetical protein
MIHRQGPQADKERLMAGQASSGRSAHAADARFDPRSGMRTATASVHTLHSPGRKGDQMESRRPSITRRMFRTLTRFVVTLLIGIGGTLAWQSYGDVARETVAARSPALAWLLPPTGWPGSASPSAAQQPAPAASGLDAVRRDVQQLAARQDQMAQSLAALLAIEVDIRQKMAFTPPSAVPIPASSQPSAPVQPYKPAQPRARPPAVQ